MSWKLDSDHYFERLSKTLLYQEGGKVSKSLGLIYEAHLPGAAVGSLCRIYPNHSHEETAVDGEVVGFRDNRILLMPFEELQGVNKESVVLLKRKISSVYVGNHLLGRVLDSRGSPIDHLGDFRASLGNFEERTLYARPTHPLDRKMVTEPLDLGVRAINGLLSCGQGQRVGVMAGSGVGKSVLLGMMARNTNADVNVIALIGERGREVREFIEKDLGPEGMKKSVVVVATSDKSPLLRMRGAFLATTIAEYFRDQGLKVLLMMDSVTRFCMAQREIGLAMGEPPASKGYTPSVFSSIPKLLERAGTSPGEGNITGIYTVLVEGDDLDDPIADSMRAILDGHIVLSRKIAQRNQFPAIDVLQSTSRVMRAVADSNHIQWASQVREWLAVYQQSEDLINIGAYVKGANPKLDQAVFVYDRILKFLKQSIQESSRFSDSVSELYSIVRNGEAFLADLQSAGNRKSVQNRAKINL